jgi:uncharacterized protein (TIGR03437 family)
VLSSEGVVEGAALTPGRPLAPGGIIAVQGSGFTDADALATSLPLARTLRGVSLRVGSEDVPLFSAGPSQVYAQVPYSVRPGDNVSVVFRGNDGRFTAPETLLIAPAQPSIFLSGDDAVILDSQFRLVTLSNPAQRGGTIQIFATGLGETNPPAQTGEAAPASAQVVLPVSVTIGGVEAAVSFQGLAAGYAGIYRVDALVPVTVIPGDNVPVVIRQNGISSNPDRPATISVR